jgi:hypothetical protein
METKTLTAPLAVIKVNGVAVGLMKDIRVNESLRRGRVSGIGRLTPHEVPALEWSGTLSCSFYTITFEKSSIQKALIRRVESVEEFVDTVLLQENGVQIDILKKVSTGIDQSRGTQLKPDLQIFASVRGCFPTKEGFNISEGQVSGKDMDFDYITPILYSL